MKQRKIGVILTYIAQLINILSRLLYTPIMLRLLGQSEYGLYQLVASVVSYMSLLSFGFAGSYMRFYNRMKVEDDEKGIAKLNGMFMLIFLVVSALCILCGGIMVGNITWIFGTGVTTEEYPLARALMVIMVVELAMTFPNSVFDCITSSEEKFFFQKLLVVLQNLLNPFIALPLLFAGFGSVGVVVVTAALTLARLIMNIWYCVGKLHAKFCFKSFDFGLLKEMFIFTSFIFISMIVDQINWSVDKVLLGRMNGTDSVAVYGVGSQLNALYLYSSAAIAYVFTPQVNRLVAEKREDFALTELFAKVGRIQFIVLSLLVTGFGFFGKVFVELWAGEGYEAAYYVALILMLSVTIPQIQNLGIEVQRAKNLHKVSAVVYLFIAVANIFISIPCIMRWGEVGAAIGTAISLIVGNSLFMNWYYHRKVGLDIGYFWMQIVRIIPGLIIPVACGILLTYFVPIEGVLELIVYAGIYVVIFGISMWLLGMNATEKGMFTQIIKKLRKRREG